MSDRPNFTLKDFNDNEALKLAFGIDEVQKDKSYSETQVFFPDELQFFLVRSGFDAYGELADGRPVIVRQTRIEESTGLWSREDAINARKEMIFNYAVMKKQIAEMVYCDCDYCND